MLIARGHIHSILLLMVCAALAPPTAHAKLNGIATSGCDGCHGGGSRPEVTVTASNPNPAPGTTITLTIGITAVNGGGGGVYILGSGPGNFSVPSGQPLKLVNPDEAVHTTTKSASNGRITFTLNWTAPSQPGGVDFDVYALATNGNGSSSGDGAGSARMSLAYGCSGNMYFRDFDGDGVGAVTSGTTVNCSAPQGYSAQSDDCNDNDEQVFPAQTEVCNGKDDDCDEQIDENLPISAFYPDADGDGYGVPGTTVMGCGPPKGYAATNNDCADNDKNRYPNAKEVCNFLDDDCDGRVDDGARVICGVGMCARYGISCDENLCTPGKPQVETCNYLDDDCDGVVDNGQTCPVGEACFQGACIPNASVPDAGQPGTDAGTSTPGNGDSPRDPKVTTQGCTAAPAVPAFCGLLLLARLLSRRRR